MIISIRKKAQEVSFVLLRVAGYIRHKELAARLESISYQLIESLYGDDMDTAMAKVESAIGLSSLASNIGEMNPNNTAIILRELENLKNGLNQLKASRSIVQMPSMEGLFSKMSIEAPRQTNSVPQQPKVSQVVNKAKVVVQSQNTIIESNGSAIMRQDNILAKIKQANGLKLQLKDIIASFPDISERTLRYDLVKLCQIGKLRREGSGGPSNFYVATDPAITSIAPGPVSVGVMNNAPMPL